MNDVVPHPAGGWVAHCECGLSARHDEQSVAWDWLLNHPCPALTDEVVAAR